MFNRLPFFFLFVFLQSVFVVNAMELFDYLHCAEETSIGRQDSPRKALFDAVRCNDVRSMQRFFAAGTIDINACDENGETALHLAVRLGFKKSICWLCEHGVNIFIENNAHEDALRLAESLCHYDALYLMTWYASGTGFDLRLLKAIFESRVDLFPDRQEAWDGLVNLVIPWSNVTPIMLACQMGNAFMVQILISHGARFDVMALLRLAARFNRYSVVELLLKYLCTMHHPSCLSDTTTYQETPLYVALKSRSDAVAGLLQEYLKRCEVCIDPRSAAYLASPA